ncbi:S41 family peptidase [Psychrosphaera sp.]|nr:S41 family peptidase [Psychrosphaera sp.]
MFSSKKLAAAILATGLLSACGGGSDSVEQVKLDDGGYAYCSAPDANEKLFAYMKNWYFWNRDLPTEFDPEAYADISSAIDSMRVAKDKFSFSMSTDEYDDYVNSVFFGYGFSHSVNETEDGLLIRYVYEAGTPAQNGLRRGDTMTEINGKPMSEIIAEVNGGSKTLGDFFGPNEDGYSIDIKFEKPNGDVKEATITKGSITANTVLAKEIKQVTLDEEEKNVGYLVFNSFDSVSEEELNTAFDSFSEDGIDELVLDLRYNGGGLIRVANQLSSQIAGDAVIDETFVQYRYNNKQSANNQTVPFSLGQGVEKMNLDRVVVLTSEGSCSSSELVINSLKPFIEVVTVGNQTCGKPVGMSPTEICNDVVFAINFDSVNAAGEGEYYDGLEVDCQVDEVVTGDWGVETDPMYAEGINYLKTGSCSNDTQKHGQVTAQSMPKVDKTKQKIDWTKGPIKAQNLL